MSFGKCILCITFGWSRDRFRMIHDTFDLESEMGYMMQNAAFAGGP